VTTPDHGPPSGALDDAPAPPPVARYDGGGPALTTDPVAVTALALSFVVAPVAVVLALVALRRTGRSGQGGRGLAITALIVSGLWLVLVAALLGSRSALDPGRDDAGTVTRPATVVEASLRAGDCVSSLPPGDADVLNVQVVPCTAPHRAQVYATFALPDGPYPGEARVEQLAADGCEGRQPDLAPTAPDDTDLSYTFPTRSSWPLDGHTVVCFVATTTPTTTPLVL
jgi:hypothetical protein